MYDAAGRIDLQKSLSRVISDEQASVRQRLGPRHPPQPDIHLLPCDRAHDLSIFVDFQKFARIGQADKVVAIRQPVRLAAER